MVPRKHLRQELYAPRFENEPLDGGFTVVGNKSAVRVMLALANAPLRFSELQLGMSSKTLSAKLKLLEQQNLITRTLHAEVPPRVVYALTEKGVELLSIIQGIFQWEKSWQQKV